MDLGRSAAWISMFAAPVLAASLSAHASAAATPAAAARTTPAAGASGACALLTADDVQSVQQSKLVRTTPTGSLLEGTEISACFLRTADFVRSVSLAWTHPRPGDTSGKPPRQRWQEMFHRQRREPEQEPMAPSGKDERDESPAAAGPEAVEGIGDEAFWVGTPAYGALYVLRGDSYLRVSAGGPGDAHAKRDAARNLAARALARLR